MNIMFTSIQNTGAGYSLKLMKVTILGGFLIVLKELHNTSVVNTSCNWFSRRILEAWEINRAENPLNRDDGLNLPKEYLHLVLKDKAS